MMKSPYKWNILKGNINNKLNIMLDKVSCLTYGYLHVIYMRSVKYGYFPLSLIFGQICKTFCRIFNTPKYFSKTNIDDICM